MSDKDAAHQLEQANQAPDDRDITPSDVPDNTTLGPTGAQHQRDARDRPRTTERIDPDEPPDAASPSLHAAKRALSGTKHREAGKGEQAATADELSEDDLSGENPHFTP